MRRRYARRMKAGVIELPKFEGWLDGPTPQIGTAVGDLVRLSTESTTVFVRVLAIGEEACTGEVLTAVGRGPSGVHAGDRVSFERKNVCGLA